MYGKYTLLDKSNPKVYAYTRESEGQKILVLLNFSSSETQAAVELNIKNAKVLLCNYKAAPLSNKEKSNISLQPYEAVVYRL